MITGDYAGRVSAWYDKEGNLIDCEQILNSGASRPIKRNGPLWRYVAKYGKRHLHTPALN